MNYIKHRDESDRLTIVFKDIPSVLYWWYKRKLVKRFKLEQIDNCTDSFNEKFQKFSCAKGNVGIDWDNWSGFLVTALDKTSEDLLLEMASYFGVQESS